MERTSDAPFSLSPPDSECGEEPAALNSPERPDDLSRHFRDAYVRVDTGADIGADETGDLNVSDFFDVDALTRNSERDGPGVGLRDDAGVLPRQPPEVMDTAVARAQSLLADVTALVAALSREPYPWTELAQRVRSLVIQATQLERDLHQATNRPVSRDEARPDEARPDETAKDATTASPPEPARGQAGTPGEPLCRAQDAAQSAAVLAGQRAAPRAIIEQTATGDAGCRRPHENPPTDVVGDAATTAAAAARRGQNPEAASIAEVRSHPAETRRSTRRPRPMEGVAQHKAARHPGTDRSSQAPASRERTARRTFGSGPEAHCRSSQADLQPKESGVAGTKRKGGAERGAPASKKAKIGDHVERLATRVRSRAAIDQFMRLVSGWRSCDVSVKEKFVTKGDDATRAVQLDKLRSVLERRTLLDNFLVRLTRLSLVRIIEESRSGRLRTDSDVIRAVLRSRGQDPNEEARKSLQIEIRNFRRLLVVCSGAYQGLECFIPLGRDDPDGISLKSFTDQDLETLHSRLDDKLTRKLCETGKTFQDCILGCKEPPRYAWESKGEQELRELDLQGLIALLEPAADS
ncbi:hypothetical protein NKR23_g10902 [Pleurostoma richardsiae]|uniref:Uncharacterized protein n=1 Tax=Pleurostoma richardsiae TaxID=41990 RepID=A0AA38R4C2_9PEZI|nr:hypothetical protein NKR23_g10902 [Pleurostoma richardsiae]